MSEVDWIRYKDDYFNLKHFFHLFPLKDVEGKYFLMGEVVCTGEEVVLSDSFETKNELLSFFWGKSKTICELSEEFIEYNIGKGTYEDYSGEEYFNKGVTHFSQWLEKNHNRCQEVCMSEWINVNDRVPEIGKRVLVFQKDGVFGGFEIDICHRIDESYPEDPEMNNRIVWDGQGISNHIYYWMPLPESPVEKK